MNDAPVVRPAQLWRRLGSRLVDTLVVVASVCVAVGGPFLLFYLAAGEDFLTERQTSADSLLFVVYASAFMLAPIGLLAVFFANEVVMTSRRSQTLGKWLLGLRVVALDDMGPTRLGYRPLVARSLILHVVPLAGFAVTALRSISGVRIDWSVEVVYISAIGAACAGLIALPVLVSKSRRGVHDWVAGTVVVSTPSALQRPSRRGPGDEGFDRWQGFLRGGGSASDPARHVSSERRAC